MDYFCVGRVAQFCRMQDDLTWEGFGKPGLFLGTVHGSLLGLSNCGHKQQGVSPEGYNAHTCKPVGRDLAANL